LITRVFRFDDAIEQDNASLAFHPEDIERLRDERRKGLLGTSLFLSSKESGAKTGSTGGFWRNSIRCWMSGAR
jgi:hypothetical protein